MPYNYICRHCRMDHSADEWNKATQDYIKGEILAYMPHHTGVFMCPTCAKWNCNNMEMVEEGKLQ